MKEFNAQTGGRYVYVDDVLNLQELALAFGEIFNECDAFIVSGCQVSGTSITSGYVYLNGKLRYFSGASGITQWPQYLYEKNTVESVQYASGNTKTGRNVYGVAAGASVPTTADAITKQTPASMTITQSGGTLMKDAFFGKYALVLNAANLLQVLNGSLKITGDLEVVGNIKSTASHYKIVEALANFDASFSGTALNMTTSFSTNQYQLAMTDDVGFVLSINHGTKATINQDGINTSGTMTGEAGQFGGIRTDVAGIFNNTAGSDTGSVDINMAGMNGGKSYYRNTNIGNGKGTAVVAVNGKAQTVTIAGVTTIASGSNSEGLILQLNGAKSTVALQKTIVWKDSNKDTMGVLGYTETTDSTFRITNNLAGVYVYGATNSFVDLGPAIKENGQLLEDKYVLQSTFTDKSSLFAKAEDVYSKKESDGRYSQLADGFETYMSYGHTKDSLRQSIGAIGSDELSTYAVSKTAYLSDIAVDDTAKQKIRDNIGAAAVDEFQRKLKDTGWLLVKDSLYARQIGNIVSIQGKLKTVHNGIVFSLPNTIDAPTHAVAYSRSLSNAINWIVEIPANSHNCEVKYCSGGCNITTGFSLTYMV